MDIDTKPYLRKVPRVPNTTIKNIFFGNSIFIINLLRIIRGKCLSSAIGTNDENDYHRQLVSRTSADNNYHRCLPPRSDMKMCAVQKHIP
jgi:hypothetical protein